jgi:hypothetical protein
MKSTVVISILIALGAPFAAGKPAIHPSGLPVVHSCLDRGSDFEIALALHSATSLFAGIGVALEWHDARRCPLGAVRITLSKDPRRKDHPGAMAYAELDADRHIVVFVDRVRESVGPDSFSRLLAYVLVHEITHLLQGVARHSAPGCHEGPLGPARSCRDHHPQSRLRAG